jgi:RimJ/RimL family protein N-acetyltransferase
MVFAVEVDAEFVGVVSLNAISTRGTASLDYWIAHPFWGKGHATEAARSAVEYASSDPGLKLLQSGCLTSNLASCRVLKKSGFSFVKEGLYAGPCQRFAGSPVCFFELRFR